MDYLGYNIIQGNGSAGNGTADIPANTTTILAIVWSFIGGTSTTPLSELCFDDGNTFDFDTVIEQTYLPGTYNQKSLCAYIMHSVDGDWPGTGTKTLYWTRISGDLYQGTNIILLYFSGIDASNAVEDFSGTSRGVGTTHNYTLTAPSGSIGVIAGFHEDADITINGGSQTQVYNTNINNVRTAIAYEADEGDLSVSSSNTRLVSIALTLNPSGAGASAVPVVWGEESPSEGTGESWSTWKTLAGDSPIVNGDSDWGKLDLTNLNHYSPVKDTGNSRGKRFVVKRDVFGTGLGTVNIYIRGSTDSFLASAETPSWELYSAPVNRVWRYVQIKTEKV